MSYMNCFLVMISPDNILFNCSAQTVAYSGGQLFVELLVHLLAPIHVHIALALLLPENAEEGAVDQLHIIIVSYIHNKSF